MNIKKIFDFQKEGIVILFVMGIVLTIFVTINGYKLVNDWYTKSIKKMGEREFTNQKIVTLVNQAVIGDVYENDENAITELKKEDKETTEKKAEDILNSIHMSNGTAYIKDLSVQIANQTVSVLGNIVLNYEEDWFRSLKSGSLPDKRVIYQDNRFVLISEGLEKYVKNREIEVEGYRYEVIGILNGYDETPEEYQICLFGVLNKNTKNLAKTKIISRLQSAANIDIVFGSNICSAEEISRVRDKYIQDNQQFFKRADIKTAQESETEDEQEHKQADTYNYQYIKIFILITIYLISLVNCYQTASLWMLMKKREIAILRICGFDKLELIKRLIGEMGSLYIISIILGGTVEIIYMIMGKNYFRTNEIIVGIIWVLLSILITVIVSMFPALKLINSRKIIEELREL